MNLCLVYKTDTEEPQDVPVLDFGNSILPPVSDPKLASKNKALVPEPLESVFVEDAPQTVGDIGVISPIGETPKIFCTTSTLSPIEVMQPFADNDTLSEISEFEPEFSKSVSVQERSDCSGPSACTNCLTEGEQYDRGNRSILWSRRADTTRSRRYTYEWFQCCRHYGDRETLRFRLKRQWPS